MKKQVSEKHKQFKLCPYHREHTTSDDTSNCKDCKFIELEEEYNYRGLKSEQI